MVTVVMIIIEIMMGIITVISIAAAIGSIYGVFVRLRFVSRFPPESEWERKARLRRQEPWNPDHYVSCQEERQPL